MLSFFCADERLLMSGCNLIARDASSPTGNRTERWTRSSFILATVICLLFVCGCRTSNPGDLAEGLPDLPPEIARTIDPKTMATKAPLSSLSSILQPLGDTARCPRCGSRSVDHLLVNYSYTRCGNYRDILRPPVSEVEFREERASLKRYKLKELNGRRFPDIQVCITSQGPWNAMLTENRSCSGSCAPTYDLTISALGNVISFYWANGIDNHPPDVYPVSCRIVSRTRTQCGMSGQCCSPGECYGECSQNCECGVPW
jgi:hypothetical protein